MRREKIKCDARHYLWDDPYLWKHCSDQVIKGCVSKTEFESILTFFVHMHVLGPKRTARKILESGIFWSSLCHDAYICFVRHVHVASTQLMLTVKIKSHKPPYLFVKFFMFGALTLWVLFLILLAMFILFAVDSKCVEAKPTPTNDSKVVVDFVNLIFFVRFGSHVH